MHVNISVRGSRVNSVQTLFLKNIDASPFRIGNGGRAFHSSQHTKIYIFIIDHSDSLTVRGYNGGWNGNQTLQLGNSAGIN